LAALKKEGNSLSLEKNTARV